MELREILDRMAHDIAERGTEPRTVELAAMARAVERVAPGAAAALSDPDGPEVARLRAFGLVHRFVLNDLESWQQEALLAELTGTAPVALVA